MTALKSAIPALLLASQIPLALQAYDEAKAGVRRAEALGPDKVEVEFGAGAAEGAIPGKASCIQVVSPDDKAFQSGVKAASAKVLKTEDDCEYPEGWKGPRFKRVLAEIELPQGAAMKPSCKYWVRVNSAAIVAMNQRSQWIEPKGKPSKDAAKPEYGLRGVSVVTPKMLEVSTGPGMDLDALAAKGSVKLSSPDDPDFKGGIEPSQIGRRSNLDFYAPKGWPWKFFQRHELFLVFDKELKKGKKYELDLNASKERPATCGTAKASILFDDSKSVSPAIKANQCGYLPDAPAKYAYAGLWAGDLNAVDLSPWMNSFEIVDASTGKTVLAGKPSLRGRATYKLVNGKLNPDPAKVKGTETVYKQDLSFEDVWEMDISALKTPGTYFIRVPGMGRSLDFKVTADVYSEPFKIMMNGLLHQRCGIELKAPFSDRYRQACHRSRTEWSSFREGVDKSPIGELEKYATDGVKHDLPGGHHDAGDWNPRAHIDVAETLFLLYEMNPSAFKDSQLRVPERGNGLPDVLDEAFWALNLWTLLQDSDGGVRNGIESAGDPKEGDSAETDSLREFAFAKDAKGSYRFAANAANASFILKGLGKPAEAKAWLDRALKAYEWAGKNGGGSENDFHAFAAATLLRATGEKRFDEDFKRHSVFSKNPNAETEAYQKHDQTLASFYYALSKEGDPAMKSAIAESFEKTFKAWEAAAETTKYRYMRSPHAPNTWGTGGLPKWLVRPAMAMKLAKDPATAEACRKWIILTDDFSLGCHPMGTAFSSGLGQRSISGTWNHLALETPGGPIPGMQSEGPGGRWDAGEKPGKGMGNWPAMSLYPNGPWPDLYKFSDNASPGMNEGVSPTQALTAFAYGLLLPGTKK